MGKLKADTIDTTGMSTIEFTDSSLYENSTNHKDFYKVVLKDTDSSSGLSEYRFSSEWTKWHGYYRNHPNFAGMIDKFGSWTIGRGIKFKKESDKETFVRLKGNGKSTGTAILENQIKVALTNGDSFAEIIKGKGFFGLTKGKLINLKPLNPGSITIVVDEDNMIIGYEQTSKVNGRKRIIATWKPEEIFHLCWNQFADEVHGVPETEKVQSILKAGKEAFLQTKVLMKRHVQPVQIYHMGTDVDSEVTAVKTKVNNAYRDTENIFVSDGTIAKVEQVGTPQYSTIDPLPWQRELKRDFCTASGMPEIIMGWGGETTEASGQILYLGFEQTISRMQLWVEENVYVQLGIEIELEFPESLADIMKQTQNKNGQQESGAKPDELNPGAEK
jgi:hypothetical protein